MFFTAKTYPPACFFKKQAGLVVVLFCQLVFQFSALAVKNRSCPELVPKNHYQASTLNEKQLPNNNASIKLCDK